MCRRWGNGGREATVPEVVQLVKSHLGRGLSLRPVSASPTTAFQIPSSTPSPPGAAVSSLTALNRLAFVGLLAANVWGFVAYPGIYCSV